MAALALAGCQGPPPLPTYPEVTFLHVTPFHLNVAEVEVVEAYVPPLRAPNVDHLAPHTPLALMRRWTADRLRPVGADGVAQVTLLDGAITWTPTLVNENIEGAFTTEQAGRYEGRMALRIELFDTAGAPAGAVSAEASRSRTVPENLTYNEREQAVFEIAEALVKDLDRSLEAGIAKYLGSAVK